MIQEMLKGFQEQVIKGNPHLEHPAVMRAIIVAAAPAGMKEEREYEIEEDTGEKRGIILRTDIFRYTVQVIDNDGGHLAGYPPLPGLLSDRKHPLGDTVLIVFPAGELNAVMVEGIYGH